MSSIEARGGSLFDSFSQLIYRKLFAHCAHFMSLIFRATKNICGLVNIEVTSSARLMNIFGNVEPWPDTDTFFLCIHYSYDLPIVIPEVLKVPQGDIYLLLLQIQMSKSIQLHVALCDQIYHCFPLPHLQTPLSSQSIHSRHLNSYDAGGLFGQYTMMQKKYLKSD